MSNLVVAALFLLGTHFGISSTHLRAQLIAAAGERTYLALYSLISFVAIAWLVVAWRFSPYDELWPPTTALRLIPILVMPLALLLLVSGLSQPNPTAVGASPDPDTTEPARGILRVTRHPVMWGFALWALSHILPNGDLASLLFFGTFAVLALVGTRLIDHKRMRRAEPGWGVFMQATSNLPFQAILEHRQQFRPREIGLARVAAALALYVLLILVHPWLFGAPSSASGNGEPYDDAPGSLMRHPEAGSAAPAAFRSFSSRLRWLRLRARGRRASRRQRDRALSPGGGSLRPYLGKNGWRPCARPTWPASYLETPSPQRACRNRARSGTNPDFR